MGAARQYIATENGGGNALEPRFLFTAPLCGTNAVPVPGAVGSWLVALSQMPSQEGT